MATTDTTTDLVIIDAENVDEDPSTGSEITKTLTVGATTMVVVAATVIAYRRLKPRVVAHFHRKMDEKDGVIEGVIVETPETLKV